MYEFSVKVSSHLHKPDSMITLNFTSGLDVVGRNPTDRPKSNGAELETRLDAYTKAANDHIASGSTGIYLNPLIFSEKCLRPLF